ncbi:hypothetical protein CORT_0D03620 [Candida orthopsilosis Co 90-125]|uniref:Major facilitator superfamily (MFS) profile domain-containing protein n=1 Tax=Candida orthopsilosis (strain 90-125) TaxID=1136231 RepID=H8X5B0_CANO9|nr:hypothetical protein CORT_0D03620 [Candida orthopsilosis Co 90-125]CCG23203.1 hypothetical protein CORT_0D03620 [Candida orthopsilosis Co 90-125]
MTLSDKPSNDNEKNPEVQTVLSHGNIDLSNKTGYELYEKAQDISEEEDIEVYKRIRWKLDCRIVPLLCITYMLQYLDKLSLNYASAYTLKEDLGLQGQRYSWVAAIFNFGYLFWAYPANYIIQKLPVAKYTGFMLFTWSIILIGHVGLKNYGGALVIRFLLGMFEAGISPSCMMICGTFFTLKQQPIRMSVFMSFNGVATMLGALLAFGLGHVDNAKINQWQLIFLVIGLINLVWSICFLWLCPDSPQGAKFLTEEEKAILIKHIASNNQGVKDQKFEKYQALEAFMDPTVIMIAAIGLAMGVSNGGASNFISALIKGFGFDGIEATALQLPLGAVELVLLILGGIISFTVKNTRCYVLFALCIGPLGGLIGLYTIPLERKWSLVGCSFMQYVVGGPIIMCWILLNANVSGSSKKTTANGLWFVMYATGNTIGANIFYAYQAPRYESGITGMITSYSGSMLLAIMIRLAYMRRNKLRDKELGEQTKEQEEQAILNGFMGMTDFENKGFRYSL